MAYRSKKKATRSRSRSGTRSYSRGSFKSTNRRYSRRGVSRRRNGGSTVRLVIEQVAANPNVPLNGGLGIPQMRGPRKAML